MSQSNLTTTGSKKFTEAKKHFNWHFFSLNSSICVSDIYQNIFNNQYQD